MSEEEFDNYSSQGGKSMTQQWLEDSFMKEIGKTPADSSPEELVAKEINVPETATATGINVDRDKMLTELDEIRDRLIDTFAYGDNQTKIGEVITEQINRISKCAARLGAQTQHFDPLDHLSGLKAPNLSRNAESVVMNTKECYREGGVKDALIAEDTSIVIKFSGNKDDLHYVATGTISAKSGIAWQGNEAIDYVYTPGSGKMSVKAFEDDKWTDKSEKFDVSWELSEIPIEEMKKGKQTQATNNEGNDFDIIEE